MRDRRFIAAHRGGLLSKADHRQLSAWAADVVTRVLRLLDVGGDGVDERLHTAISTARAWSRGEVPVGAGQKAAVAAHAAARASRNAIVVAVARAAGHAVATAHMAEHALGAAIYGCKVAVAAGESARSERAWQVRKLPVRLRAMVVELLAKKEGARCWMRWDRMKRSAKSPRVRRTNAR